MNFQFYLEKLKASKEFQDFKNENPGSYLCSGFFTIDLEGQDNQRHIDFYIPERKEMVSFKLGSEIEKVPVETISEIVPGEISEKEDFNFEEVQSIVEKEMENQAIKNKLQKIIISFQSHEGKVGLFCTVFVSMLGLLKVNIDSQSKNVTLFEKRSFFDMMKRIK